MKPAERAEPRRGFTLLEVSVTITLMLLVLGMTAYLLGSSLQTITTEQARMDVQGQARFAFDRLRADLLGILPAPRGGASIAIENGKTGVAGREPVYGPEAGEDEPGRCADRIRILTQTVAGEVPRVLEVTYELKRPGDPARRRGKRSGRPLYVLVRSVRSPSDDSVSTEEECAVFVTSFNVEVIAEGGNWTGGAEAARLSERGRSRVRGLRILMQIADDAGEMAERTFVSEFWIPCGD